jgi:SAM-dependent methyltransferase
LLFSIHRLNANNTGLDMSRAKSVSDSIYIHGSSPAEQTRLSTLNDVLNGAALRELAITPGTAILDVGSGLGQLTRALARASGVGGRVVGVERDRAQFERARALQVAAGEENLVEFRMGDAATLPLSPEEIGSFDLTHARFVLEHVVDPLAVVREMKRATRPGGRIVLQDDDHDVLRLWPEPAGFAALWQAYIESYRGLGNDPFVGRRLVSLLVEAGVQPTRNTWIFFGTCAGQKNFDDLAENLIGILSGARACLLEQGLVSDQLFDEGMKNLREWKTRADSALWYAICYAEGIH